MRVRRVLLVETGPARAIVRVETEIGRSELVEDYVLSAGDRAVEVRVLLDWREKARLLKLRYPTRLTDTRAVYEIPYGTIERPANGEEEPGQRWVEVNGRLQDADGMYGLAVLNDAKYGFDVHEGDVAVTAVRSPIYAHHDPTVPRAEIRYGFQDQGFQRFTLALLPHRGAPADAGVTRRAYELNQRATVLLESHHAGTLPQVASHGSVEGDAVALGALKLAEDGSGDVVVRAVDVSGRGCRARVRLSGCDAEIEADMAPHDIRTWRISAATGTPVETDLLERPLTGA
jgi:alpha-mannosidase